jgi:hypothetical protein
MKRFLLVQNSFESLLNYCDYLLKKGCTLSTTPKQIDESYCCEVIINTISDEMVKILPCEIQASENEFQIPKNPYLIGKYLVTLGHWNHVRSWGVQNGYDLPSGRVVDDEDIAFDDPFYHFQPASWISFYDACKWCNAKSEMENLSPVYFINGKVFRFGKKDSEQLTWDSEKSGFRLPTGDEWEWAARGGIFSQSNINTYSGGDDFEKVAWQNNERSGPNYGVGEKLPNELEIYDMTGLANEWCWDSESETDQKMIRGGYGRCMRVDYLEHFKIDHIYFQDPCHGGEGNGFRIANFLNQHK